MQLAASDRVASFIPLLGGALFHGNAWPDYYREVALPQYYVDYYDLGRSAAYRYANEVLYRIDPESALITSVAALLTGERFTIGQPVPAGFEIYNLPPLHRETYRDSAETAYRYSDGYIYRIDRTTGLVAAAIGFLDE